MTSAGGNFRTRDFTLHCKMFFRRHRLQYSPYEAQLIEKSQ